MSRNEGGEMNGKATVDLRELRKPFAPELVGKLPRVTCPECSDRRKQCTKHTKVKCGECQAYVSERHIHIDYVGHADVTSKLLEVDPEWGWEPKSKDVDKDALAAAVASGNPEVVRLVLENAPPKFDLDADGNPVGLWINLTVGDVTRPGYGSVPSGQPDAVKVLIGDALRNAAMRFGVALDLWAKGDRADPTAENATASAGKASRGGRQSAAGAFENAAPAPPRQDGSSAGGQQWLTAALRQAPNHATIDACKAVWQKSTAMVHDGTLGKADAAKLQGILRKRMEELKAEPVAAVLDPADPWASAIDGLASPEDADVLLGDLIDQRSRGEIDPERAALIEQAITARFPDSGEQAAA